MKENDGQLPTLTSLFKKGNTKPHEPHSAFDDHTPKSPLQITRTQFLIVDQRPLARWEWFIYTILSAASSCFGYRYAMDFVRSFFKDIESYLGSTIPLELVNQSYVQVPVAILWGGTAIRLSIEIHRLVDYLTLQRLATRRIESSPSTEGSPILVKEDWTHQVCPAIPVESRYKINRLLLTAVMKRLIGFCLDLITIALLAMIPGYARTWLSILYVDPTQQNRMTRLIEPIVMFLTVIAILRLLWNSHIASHHSEYTFSKDNKVIVLEEQAKEQPILSYSP